VKPHRRVKIEDSTKDWCGAEQPSLQYLARSRHMEKPRSGGAALPRRPKLHCIRRSAASGHHQLHLHGGIGRHRSASFRGVEMLVVKEVLVIETVEIWISLQTMWTRAWRSG